MLPSIAQRIAAELNVGESQVAATIGLLDSGATVPFIARYRKEVTGGLDDTQLRQLTERLYYLTELDERRQVILKSITEQEKMTPELEASLFAAESKTALEDLYLPYKPKRRTRAQMAREAGLMPLAESLLADPSLDPLTCALAYVNANVADARAALEGARAILMERFAENAELLGVLRETLWNEAELRAQVIADKEAQGSKFADYFDHCERLRTMPSHRVLAILRGRNEGVLSLSLRYQSDDIPSNAFSHFENSIAAYFHIEEKGRLADKWLLDSVRLAWRAKIFLSFESELLTRVKEKAEAEAISVFAANLCDLLLAAPAGRRTTMGLDPGLRTGVKVAVVDGTGKLLETTTIYPHAPKNDWKGALAVLAMLVERHRVELIAIGNGTASRETDKWVQQLLKEERHHHLTKVVVSEAGASVYSASELAAHEFPQLDVSLRGAVSIARRLQDPLAELVKIDPKSIGVGQYQHDVNQSRLARALDTVVEDCVNRVGVDVNTASVALLTRISGLNSTIASNIVAWRNQHGAFPNRRALRQVPRLGDRTFEQAAGFLRVMDGDNPLDASAVHPEAYPVVEHIARHCRRSVHALIGDTALLASLPLAAFVNDQFGLPTVKDILRELDKPGRDPRPLFKTASFLEGVEDITELAVGMILEGVVTNVTNFGAFVDIGVHQDGLVHISALSTRYVDDPRKVVKAGDIVTVRVVNVDVVRRRIALTMCINDKPELEQGCHDRRAVPTVDTRKNKSKRRGSDSSESNTAETAMAAAFAKLTRVTPSV